MRYPSLWAGGTAAFSAASSVGWTDQGNGNDVTRSFCWWWSGHGSYKGWSHGNSQLPAAGFQNAGEGHPIDCANVYVEC